MCEGGLEEKNQEGEVEEFGQHMACCCHFSARFRWTEGCCCCFIFEKEIVYLAPPELIGGPGVYFQIPGGNKYLREIEKLAVQEMEEGQVINISEVSRKTRENLEQRRKKERGRRVKRNCFTRRSTSQPCIWTSLPPRP